MSIKKLFLASLLLITPAACSRSETPKEEQKQVATAQPPAQQQPEQQPATQTPPPQVEQQQAPAEATPTPAERPRVKQQPTRRSRTPKPADETYTPPPANQEAGDQHEPIVPPSPSRRQGTGNPSDSTWQSGQNNATATPVTPPPPPKPTTAVLPEGTVVDVRLAQRLSSATNQVGDTFEAILDRDLIVDGQMLAPKGSKVTGKVTDVVGSGKVKGLAHMTLALSAIKVGEDRYPVNTSTISVEAENTKKRDAETIGAGAAIGAAIGAIAGGKKGALIGAGVGGGAGTAGVLATKGKEVEFEPEHRFSFRLEKDVTMKIRQ
jgi:hypothetical protein